MIRVWMVTKTNGKQDILNKAGVIPKTVKLVHIAWADGKGDNNAELSREEFLNNFKWVSGCNWKTI